MTTVRVVGGPNQAGVVVKATPSSPGTVVKGTPVSPRSIPGPVGPPGPAGPPGGELISRAVAEGDPTPDPGAEKLAWSTVTNSLVMYVENRWRAVSPGISVGTVAPANPVLNQIWVDTN